MSLERSRDVDIQTEPTIDELLEKAGDVGRFQYIAFLALYLLISPNGFLIYNLPYLTLQPQLECQQNQSQVWTTCSKELACQATQHGLTRYRIDDDNSLTNLITETPGLECRDDVMSIGSYFFFGVFLSFILWVKCTDMWSRKPIVILGSSLQLIAFAGILLLPTKLLAL